jgi:glycosyltransferase involved in cell wall biosynthesis
MSVYHEQTAIGGVREKWDSMLRGLGIDYIIRPYNDGSKDDSLAVMQDVANRLGPQIEIRDKENGGHGNTILTGYREAAADGFEWVFQIDSDDEMEPERFVELWKLRNDYDFLVGTRDGRKQVLSRRVISFISRLTVKSFYGKGIWDVNTPYRLMRVSAFKKFFEQIPLNTFAPNVIISGLAARHGLRCFEMPVPQRDRTTGEVSIKKWKLARAAMLSFIQLIAFSLRAPDVNVNKDAKWYKIGIGWLIFISAFAWLPDTFFNWGFNYLSFMPVAFSVVVFAVSALILVGPLDRFMPGLFGCPIIRKSIWISAICIIPLVFWIFRTRIHCFSGDGAVGGIVPDTVLHFADFVPSPPWKGRLDCWGMLPLEKILLRYGWVQDFTGMIAHFVSQVYSVAFGAMYVLLTLIFFRRSSASLCILLTMPYVFNFFGNLDCYSFSLCIAVVFAFTLAVCDAQEDCLELRSLIISIFVWLIGLWTHPFFIFGGFLLCTHAARYINHRSGRAIFDAKILEMLFAILLFVAISMSQHAKPFFVWTYGGRPPVFSIDTLIHLLNVVLLPIAPLAISVMVMGKRKERSEAVWTFALMAVCFLPLGFTQGANDQFPYMHLLFFMALPFLLYIKKHGMTRSGCRFLLSANLFLLIPMVAVHSSERTVVRAERLYPIDPCKHNREMSWQTHLGLILGDNIVDSKMVKNATLRTFANGARHAQPEGFRGGNYIYHTAFLYHFGEFEQGRRQLFNLLRQDVNSVRYFIGHRPAFIYCNRKILWDDIEMYFSKNIPASYPLLKDAIKGCRDKAVSEPFYINRPKYAKSEY